MAKKKTAKITKATVPKKAQGGGDGASVSGEAGSMDVEQGGKKVSEEFIADMTDC